MTATGLSPSPAVQRPAGQKGPRGALLVELKRAQPIAAKELAGRLRVSLNAVRHHLKELEAEGLVAYERQHRGVGAPVFAYRLTEAGESLFPRRYEETLATVLEHLAARDGRPAVVALLEARFDALAERLGAELKDVSPERRLEMVSRVLSEQGYMAESGCSGANGVLVEHNCAIQSVAAQFPEICRAEARFLERVLDAGVERRAHILTGCGACRYEVTFRGGSTAASSDVVPLAGAPRQEIV